MSIASSKVWTFAAVFLALVVLQVHDVQGQSAPAQSGSGQVFVVTQGTHGPILSGLPFLSRSGTAYLENRLGPGEILKVSVCDTKGTREVLVGFVTNANQIQIPYDNDPKSSVWEFNLKIETISLNTYLFPLAIVFD